MAVDGISLTIVDCGGDWFTVSLIPHTRNVTVLSGKKAGDNVNLETDVLGKYIYKMMNPNKSAATEKSALGENFLAQHGFLD